MSPAAEPPARPHVAMRVEDAVQAVAAGVLRRAGWVPRVVPHVGYGLAGQWVRVLARVVLVPEGSRAAAHPEDARGWRRFVSQSAHDVPLEVEVGGTRSTISSDRDGYVDVRIDADLPAGWGEVLLTLEDGTTARAPVHVVAAEATHGLVSDVDDTVMVTMLPRPLLAFRNAFLTREDDREPVPGMATLYDALLAARPGTFVVYLSTGAWNVAPAIGRFLRRHGFPAGPVLLTDWGPTSRGWFRSGQQHKLSELRRLMDDLPGLIWVLVGDDGQHDPSVYDGIAAEHPGRVDAVLIRQLSTAEQVVGHGSVGPVDPPSTSPRSGLGPDGAALAAQARRLGLLAD